MTSGLKERFIRFLPQFGHLFIITRNFHVSSHRGTNFVQPCTVYLFIPTVLRTYPLPQSRTTRSAIQHLLSPVDCYTVHIQFILPLGIQWKYGCWQLYLYYTPKQHIEFSPQNAATCILSRKMQQYTHC